MKLEDIVTSWKQDSKIDESELGTESLRVPELHHKYFTMFVEERLTLKSYEQKYKNLYKLKFEYYMGYLDEDQLKEQNWEPQPLRILKQDLQIYMDSDEDLSLIHTKVS